jgi:hypothetical protein
LNNIQKTAQNQKNIAALPGKEQFAGKTGLAALAQLSSVYSKQAQGCELIVAVRCRAELDIPP